MTVVLLIASNTFMTFAWYGHLKHRSAPLWEAILFSWLIALGEYCLRSFRRNRGLGMGVFGVSAEDRIQEGDYARRVFGVFAWFLPRRSNAMELCRVVLVAVCRRRLQSRFLDEVTQP